MRDTGRMSPARYREIAPPAAWQHQVRRLWRYRAGPRPITTTRVLPDGCIDLIWDGCRLIVAGPDPVAVETRIAPGSVLIGVRLAPGAARGLLGLPASALTAQRVALHELWGARADALVEQLASATCTPGRHLLAALAAVPGQTDIRMARLFARLAAGETQRLPQLAAALGCSERALRRHCLEHFGYGPKTLQRILRLQRLLALAPSQASLTDAALAAGYADSAHLAHETQALTGLAPGELLRQHRS